MKKTIYIAWNGISHPVTVAESATVGQIINAEKVRAALNLPDNCIAVFNGVQGYEGPIQNQQTIQIISRPAQKAA